MNKKLFIDLGAHKGDSIDKFHAQVSDADKYDIVSFEPDPFAFKALNGYILLRNYKNVTTINLAAGNYTGITNLFMASMYEGRGNTLLRNKITSKINYKSPVEVRCINFCDWLERVESKYDYIILKMNIEGSEYRIMKELLRRKMVGKINYYCIYFHTDRFAINKRRIFSIIEDSFIKETKRLNIPLCVNRHSFDKDDRPEILWVYDTPDWAYDRTTIKLSLRLPRFRHVKLHFNRFDVRGMGKIADLIVCFIPQYVRFFDDLSKVITRLDSSRILKYADNTKHRECQELELVPGVVTANEEVSTKI